VVALYEADRKLRTLIHDGMERIQVMMRTRVTELLYGGRARASEFLALLSSCLTFCGSHHLELRGLRKSASTCRRASLCTRSLILQASGCLLGGTVAFEQLVVATSRAGCRSGIQLYSISGQAAWACPSFQ
jgi:hypothetical protein